MSKSKSIFNMGDSLLMEKNTDFNKTRLLDLFTNLALNRFKWENLPKGIEGRHIEKALFFHGQAGLFDDSDYGLLCLPCSDTSNFNVYGEPTSFNLHGIGYQKIVNADEVIRIMNNDSCTPSSFHVSYYALKISEVDKAIDVNLRHQKTPYIVATSKQNELSMKNLIKQIQEDKYAIYVDDKLSQSGDIGISVENTNAPFLIDKLQEHKNNLVNEFLTIMGLNNTNANNHKKERLLVDEVNVNNNEILMYLDIDYKNRLKACEEINKKYGLNVTVEKQIDYLELDFLGQGGEVNGILHNRD